MENCFGNSKRGGDLLRVLIIRSLLVAVTLSAQSAAWAQNVEGVRGFDGGVAPLFNLPGPGRLYIDNQGTQGYIYNQGNFQTHSFQTPGGASWSGAQMTLGSNLTIGLIQGANQGGSAVRLPSAPRQTLPLPLIQSTIQSMSILQTPTSPQGVPQFPTNQPLQLFPDFDQVP